jgi:hypothetical protein
MRRLHDKNTCQTLATRKKQNKNNATRNNATQRNKPGAGMLPEQAAPNI